MTAALPLNHVTEYWVNSPSYGLQMIEDAQIKRSPMSIVGTQVRESADDPQSPVTGRIVDADPIRARLKIQRNRPVAIAELLAEGISFDDIIIPDHPYSNPD